MNELQRVFDFRGQEVRTVIQKDEPWFIAADVCKVLDIKNVTQALQRLEEDERSMFNIGRQGNANTVNEPGLYELIFASRKPEAKLFKRWVKQEVLPSIRKTGQYSNVKVLDERTALISSLKLTAETAERVDSMEDQIKELNTKVEEQITLSSGEQRRVQKGVARRVYEFTEDRREAAKLFRELYREIKDRFGVASYKDVKKKELQSAINYIEHWIPKQVS
ncbi:phage antirepressor [Rossellomorea vietnamensis]|uniref:Phage antirepressor n=1 Tax=Rossellomorea vietnamensis TaxID=218284 RepID=A0A5D4MB78_9BACI|nr:BRO family protein [Rossellomorea vietnamensis]TYR99104.1 phage antirepressor [Rossellomorea vietnamensis]